ncbi:hypothetical protein ACIRU3_44285 [Streptomyces sp. NPDC101151]
MSASTPTPAPPLQALVAATTKKDSGMVTPLADALNEIIHNGTYTKVL